MKNVLLMGVSALCLGACAHRTVAESDLKSVVKVAAPARVQSTPESEMPVMDTGDSGPEIAAAPATNTARMVHRMMAAVSPDEEAKAVAYCAQNSSDENVTPAQQGVIDAFAATPEHRMEHALWHAIRSGLSQAQMDEIVGAFGDTWADVAASKSPEKPGLSQFHHMCPQPVDYQKSLKSVIYNPSGEDFLFMHHNMLIQLEKDFLVAQTPCIKPLADTLNDMQVPTDSTSGPKSADALAQMQRWDAYLKANLSKMSLSQLGWALEFSIHNNLHMRFATENPPDGFKDAAPLELNKLEPQTWDYNQPAYNWLADPYGAAVNPRFWRIHGYVDHFIGLWIEAHPPLKRIAVNCESDKACYTWRGTWTGNINTPPVNVGVAAAPGAAHGSVKTPEEIKADIAARLRHTHLGILTDEVLQKAKEDLRRATEGRQKSVEHDSVEVAAAPGGGAVQFTEADNPLNFANQELCPKSP